MFEMIVGLHVTDAAGYDSYRKGMTPILETFDGFFRYDFKIAETLKSDASHPMNRVFSLCFPDRSRRDAFFSNSSYLAVRSQFLEKSISGRTLIAEYER